ncbi:MAG: FHA domain-containing protein [Chloroflexi bacterium]|nr:FHA domain-containing protein [Chloroflexota bacterium]
MSPAFALFLLRLVLALLLYTFLGGILYLLWLDTRQALARAQARDRARGRLVLIACDLPSPSLGETFPLLPLTSIGRAPTNTVPLPDETASLEHALITHRNGKWWLEDLDSRNGTTLNGQAVTTPTVVSTGDVVGLGRAQFKLEVE